MQALRYSATRASSIDCFVIFVCPLLLYQNIIKSRMFATVQITADWTLLMSPTELLILWLVCIICCSLGNTSLVWVCRRYYLPNLICEPPHLARSRSKNSERRWIRYLCTSSAVRSIAQNSTHERWLNSSCLRPPTLMIFITRCVKSTCKSNQLGCQINSSIYLRPSLSLPYPLSG